MGAVAQARAGLEPGLQHGNDRQVGSDEWGRDQPLLFLHDVIFYC